MITIAAAAGPSLPPSLESVCRECSSSLPSEELDSEESPGQQQQHGEVGLLLIKYPAEEEEQLLPRMDEDQALMVAAAGTDTAVALAGLARGLALGAVSFSSREYLSRSRKWIK